MPKRLRLRRSRGRRGARASVMKKKKERMPQGDHHPRQSRNVVAGRFDGDLILFHQLSKQYFLLNTVAVRIWQLCDGSRPAEEVAAVIAGEFDAPPEQLADDVRQTMGGLAELGLLEV